jgi:hypothetical protein
MTERTPEQLGKETGEALGFAIANGLEPILMRLADAVAKVQVEQAEIRDELVDLTDRFHKELHRNDDWITALAARVVRLEKR